MENNEGGVKVEAEELWGAIGVIQVSEDGSLEKGVSHEVVKNR